MLQVLTRRRLSVAIAVALAAVVLTACGSSSRNGGGATGGAAGTGSSGGSGGSYRIGFSDGLTGADSAYTGPELKWVKAVFGQVNASGGINGHKIELTALDQGNPGSGQANGNVTQLATSDHVSAILGMLIDNDCDSVASLAARYQTPLLCQRAAPNYLNPVNKDVFVDTDYNPQEAGSQIAFLKTLVKPGAKIAIINSDLTGPDNWASKLAGLLPKGGFKVATVQKYETTATNISPQISAVVASHPAAVVVEVFNQFYEPLVRALHAAGLKIPVVVTSGGIFGSTMQSLADPDLYETQLAAPVANTPAQKGLIAQFAKLGDKTLEKINDGEGSDLALGPYAVVAALKQCGYPCPGSKMATALEQVSTTDGGLIPGGFGYTPQSHIGVRTFFFTHWDPKKHAITVAARLPAAKPF